MKSKVPLLAVVLLLPACTDLPPIDFQRMIYQNRFTVWQRCDYFPDERADRTPPAGTLPRGAFVADSALATGMTSAGYVRDVPVALTRDLLLKGKEHFETYCAACHGILGDGVSIVALNMSLRRPPAIAGRAARALPPGRVYQVIDQGYGLMRSYSEAITTPEERWAVVAYLQALQLSHAVPLDSLPADVRREAEEQTR
jgi:mono/diheme cytochrome c family protein